MFAKGLFEAWMPNQTGAINQTRMREAEGQRGWAASLLVTVLWRSREKSLGQLAETRSGSPNDKQTEHKTNNQALYGSNHEPNNTR